MRLGVASGPLLLLLWQAAPYGAEQDSTGRTRVVFGFGAGQYESRSLDCSGAVLSHRPVPYQTAGAEIDAWSGRRGHFTLYAGDLHTGPTERFGGAFGGAMAAFEGRYVGVGGGVGGLAGVQGFASPALYLRLGDIDKLHFRTDLFGPGASMPTTGWARIGVGFNQGHLRGPSGYFGLGVRPFADEAHLGGGFGDFSFPLNRQLDFTVSGGFRPSAGDADWGLSGGFRYSF